MSATHPVFRFAPSPNGRLHLGHAYSALLNRHLADKAGGQLLLRIEDIDVERCRPEFETALRDDLDWLGIRFDGRVRRQSDHFETYRQALETLRRRELVYPAFLSRGEIRALIAERKADGAPWPLDPDGAPLYPGNERTLRDDDRRRRIASGAPFAWRLDMAKASALAGPLTWREVGEAGEERVAADPLAWGDVILARRDVPTSYHLAVIVDDAHQGVTHVVRGRDLYHATSVHRLLQVLLGLPEPVYRHHRLVLDADARKLSKSAGSESLGALRQAGETPGSIRQRLGFD